MDPTKKRIQFYRHSLPFNADVLFVMASLFQQYLRNGALPAPCVSDAEREELGVIVDRFVAGGAASRICLRKLDDPAGRTAQFIGSQLLLQTKPGSSKMTSDESVCPSLSNEELALGS